MSHRLGRRARRRRNLSLPLSAASDPWALSKARYCSHVMPAAGAALIFPVVGAIGLMFDVYDNAGDFACVSVLLWLGGFSCGLAAAHNGKFGRWAWLAGTGALIGYLIAAVLDATPENCVFALACGALSGLITGCKRSVLYQ